MNSSMPFLSVVLSVYNGEKYINQCIDSLIYQSFDNYEIIVVNKASTDRTSEILKLYEDNFSEKIRIINAEYSPNAAMGRNIGIKAARGKYVCFCDADDYFELNSFKDIYDFLESKEAECDILVFDVFIMNGKETVRQTSVSKYNSKESFILYNDLMTFWRTAIRRDFLLSQFEIPSFISDDIASLPIYMCNAKNVMFFNKPLYHYSAYNGMSNSQNEKGEHKLEILDGFDFLLSKTDQKYLEIIVFFAVKKIINVNKSYWNLKEKISEWISCHEKLIFNNKYIRNDKIILKYLNNLKDFFIDDLIPKVVYINGFDGISEERIAYVQQNAFLLGETQVIVLDRTNCDLSLLPYSNEAIENKRFDYVGHFFALKNIYESGGFFVGNSIEFIANLNIKRIYSGVFSYFDSYSFTDEIFGSKRGTEIIKVLLDTYKTGKFYDDPFEKLSNRIKNILLTYLYNLKLNGETITTKGININSPKCFVIPAGGEKHISRMRFENNSDEDLIEIPYSLYSYMCQQSFDDTEKKTEANLKREISDLKKELDNIKKSDSYKLIKQLKKIGNMPIGRQFKKLFKFFLKFYRKHKYGIT